jgi:hypothetical protein
MPHNVSQHTASGAHPDRTALLSQAGPPPSSQASLHCGTCSKQQQEAAARNPCTAVQCSAAQCSAVQCSAVQCSAVQCSAVQCSAAQCSAVQRSAVQTCGLAASCTRALEQQLSLSQMHLLANQSSRGHDALAKPMQQH